jgi:hypothetical protein
MRLIRSFIENIGIKTYIGLHIYLHRKGILPLSRNFGSERGNPVGRYYVETFLRRNSQYIIGRCLEFGEARYKSYFFNAEQYEVISIIDGPDVDYVADIHDAKSLPNIVFDSIICTQVFEHLAYPEKAAFSLFNLLKPNGVLLFTAPFTNQVHYCPTDYHRFTPECCRLILENAGFRIEEIDFGGNCMVCTGSLMGMVTEDFKKYDLEYQDPIYPYNILIRARHP